MWADNPKIWRRAENTRGIEDGSFDPCPCGVSRGKVHHLECEYECCPRCREYMLDHSIDSECGDRIFLVLSELRDGRIVCLTDGSSRVAWKDKEWKGSETGFHEVVCDCDKCVVI